MHAHRPSLKILHHASGDTHQVPTMPVSFTRTAMWVSSTHYHVRATHTTTTMSESRVHRPTKPITCSTKSRRIKLKRYRHSRHAASPVWIPCACWFVQGWKVVGSVLPIHPLELEIARLENRQRKNRSHEYVWIGCPQCTIDRRNQWKQIGLVRNRIKGTCMLDHICSHLGHRVSTTGHLARWHCVKRLALLTDFCASFGSLEDCQQLWLTHPDPDPISCFLSNARTN